MSRRGDNEDVDQTPVAGDIRETSQHGPGMMTMKKVLYHGRLKNTQKKRL